MTPTPRAARSSTSACSRSDLLRAQRRRRLVHDEHLRIGLQRLDDLEHLPLGQRKAAHRRRDVDLQVVRFDDRRRPPLHRAVGRPQGARRGHEDVLRDGQLQHAARTSGTPCPGRTPGHRRPTPCRSAGRRSRSRLRPVRGRRWRCPAASTSRIRSRPRPRGSLPLRHSMLTSSRACTAPKRLEIPFSERTTGRRDPVVGRHRLDLSYLPNIFCCSVRRDRRGRRPVRGDGRQQELSSTCRSDGLKMISDGIGAPCPFIIAAVSAVRPCVNSAGLHPHLEVRVVLLLPGAEQRVLVGLDRGDDVERLVGRLEGAHRADRGVAVVVADALEVGVLAQDPGHRLQRALARPVRVGGRDDLDVGVQGLPLALLPRRRVVLPGVPPRNAISPAVGELACS